MAVESSEPELLARYILTTLVFPELPSSFNVSITSRLALTSDSSSTDLIELAMALTSAVWFCLNLSTAINKLISMYTSGVAGVGVAGVSGQRSPLPDAPEAKELSSNPLLPKAAVPHGDTAESPLAVAPCACATRSREQNVRHKSFTMCSCEVLLNNRPTW